MNYDKLVDLIVQEVYKKLQETVKMTKKNQTAVIIGEEDLTTVTKAIGDNFNVTSYGDGDVVGDVIIVSALTIKSMANLATLTGTNDEENFIIRSLMEGKKVYLLEDGLEYRRYKNTAPKALYNKYLDFEKELKVYGVNVISYIGNVVNNVTKKEDDIINTSVAEIISPVLDEVTLEIRNKKLISEADLRKPFINGMKSLIIDKKSIITPLANDFIRIHNLKVKRV